MKLKNKIFSFSNWVENSIREIDYSGCSRMVGLDLLFAPGLNFDHRQRNFLCIGYIPVTANLACPLIDYATRERNGIRYEDFTVEGRFTLSANLEWISNPKSIRNPK